MINDELIRLVDSLHRDKGIDKEVIFESIEMAMITASRRQYNDNDVTVQIDRDTGEMYMYVNDEPVDAEALGRIAAQTAKQVVIQKIREAERDVVFTEYENRKNTLVNGTVQRFERGSIIVSLGKAEGVLPRQEQVFNENYHPGDRIRAFVTDVRKKGQKVNIVLSRKEADLVSALFAVEVPEITDRIVEIYDLVREAGHRTKIAVFSSDSRIDCIGACVGIRGSRIRNIVDELNGEKIDIVRYSEVPKVFIRNALAPAEVVQIFINDNGRDARVVVPDDQLSLAIGKKGQNVRLSSKLTKLNLDIITEEQFALEREVNSGEIANIPGIEPVIVERMMMTGLSTIQDIVEKGVEGVMTIKDIDEESQAEAIVAYAKERLEPVQEEIKRRIEAMIKERQAARNRPQVETPAPELSATQDTVDSPSENSETSDVEADSDEAN